MARQQVFNRYQNMKVKIGELEVVTPLNVSGPTTLDDDSAVILGTGSDAYLLWSTGDASNHATVLGLGDSNQALHVTDKGARATDWNVSADTHPTVYIHSNTTPATDYLKIGAHTGSAASLDLVGATTLNLNVGDGLEVLKLVGVASAVNELTLTSSATTDPILLAATGGDTDIGIGIAAKGAGYTRVTTGGFQIHSSAAVTATVGGGTTGLIPAGTTFVVVTSDDANKQISLPAATVGDRIRILVGATGCELISAVAAHKVNDVVVGATNEAALTATNFYDCWYVATNTWLVIGYTKLGAVEAALVPDSL